MALRKIGKYYHVYWQDQGRQHTMSLHVTDKQEALRVERQMMEARRIRRCTGRIVQEFPEITQLIAQQSAEPAETISPRRSRGLKLTDMWELAEKRRALSSNHRKIWNKFLERTKHKYASDITPPIALEYLETYHNTGNGKTYNNVKSALNTIFRCCLVEANMQQSPFTPIVNRRVTEVNHHRNLTLDEFDRLLGIAPKQLQIAMMLSRWTTQRLETVTRMTPDMFDFEKLVFIIDPAKNKRFDEWVCCPILPELEEYIRPILAECPDNGKAIVKQISDWKNHNYTVKFSRMVKELGIPSSFGATASFHSIRGTAITWFKENGVKGDELHSMTGHDSTDVEDVYARDIASLSRIAHAFRSKTM